MVGGGKMRYKVQKFYVSLHHHFNLRKGFILFKENEIKIL